MKINELVILAGGLATRMKPVTETIPKSLIEVAGKPFIQLQLELLKIKGIKKAVICAGYLGEKIEEFVKDGSRFGIEVKYSFDGERLLGTGGAVKNCLGLISENFFIMYGDSYLNTDFEIINEYYLTEKKQGLMTVLKNEGKWDKSNIEMADGKILDYDKNQKSNKLKYIDYGLGILSKDAFNDFKEKEVFDLEEVYRNLLKKNELSGFEVKERFYEIGSFSGLSETEKFIKNKK